MVNMIVVRYIPKDQIDLGSLWDQKEENETTPSILEDPCFTKPWEALSRLSRCFAIMGA